MKSTPSEMVREIAERDFVRPAKNHGGEIRIRVGDLERKLRREGFPERHINQVCSALESRKFWGTRGLRPLSPQNQPRRVDTVYEFSFSDWRREQPGAGHEQDPLLELAGSLKGAILEGADAFVRELRRDKGPAL